jgi:hypothetical protein
MPAELRVTISGLRESRDVARVTVEGAHGHRDSKLLFVTSPAMVKSGGVVSFPGIVPGRWNITVTQGPRTGRATAIVPSAEVASVSMSVR